MIQLPCGGLGVSCPESPSIQDHPGLQYLRLSGGSLAAPLRQLPCGCHRVATHVATVLPPCCHHVATHVATMLPPMLPPCCHPCCRDSAKPPPGNPGDEAGLAKCKTDLTKCKADLTKCKAGLTKCKAGLTKCQFPSLQQSQNRKWLIELAGAVSQTGPRQTTLLEILRTLLAGLKSLEKRSVSELPFAF